MKKIAKKLNELSRMPIVWQLLFLVILASCQKHSELMPAPQVGMGNLYPERNILVVGGSTIKSKISVKYTVAFPGQMRSIKTLKVADDHAEPLDTFYDTNALNEDGVFEGEVVYEALAADVGKNITLKVMAEDLQGLSTEQELTSFEVRKPAASYMAVLQAPANTKRPSFYSFDDEDEVSLDAMLDGYANEAGVHIAFGGNTPSKGYFLSSLSSFPLYQGEMNLLVKRPQTTFKKVRMSAEAFTLLTKYDVAIIEQHYVSAPMGDSEYATDLKVGEVYAFKTGTSSLFPEKTGLLRVQGMSGADENASIALKIFLNQ